MRRKPPHFKHLRRILENLVVTKLLGDSLRCTYANLFGGARSDCTVVPNHYGGTRNHCTAVPNVSGGTRNHCTAVPEIRSRALWRPVFGHAVRCIPLGANNQWEMKKTPTD